MRAMLLAGVILLAFACAAAVPTVPEPPPPPPRVQEYTFPLALPGNTKVCVESNKPVMASVRCMSLAELRAILYGHKA